MATLIRTPLRYPGGKHRVSDMLVENVCTDFEEYREPFVGGGSVFLKLKQKYPDRKYWINDLYYDLYCFWEVLKDNPAELVALVEMWREQFKDLVPQLFEFLVNNRVKFSKAQTAAGFFILNRITFSGTSLSGGYSKRSYYERFTESSIDRLVEVPALLNDVEVTNEGYEVLMDTPGDGVFIYLDPPYYTAARSALYGSNGDLHVGFDHERLLETCKRCNHKIMITYDDCDYIRDLYKDFNIDTFTNVYGMRNVVKDAKMHEGELLIKNF
jgi:DNA adenine methylase